MCDNGGREVIPGRKVSPAAELPADDLRTTIRELRDSRMRLARAADAERRRIARRLHEGAQQTLVLLAIESEQLRLQPDDPNAVRAAAGDLRRKLDLTLDDLRALSRELLPPLLAERGLRTAVEELAAAAPFPVKVEADPRAEFEAPEHVLSTGYFATRQALANVAKHTGATHATVSLHRDRDDVLHIDVVDDGVGGADPARETGNDRVGDRVAAVGGSFAVESSQSGTRVTIELPCG